MRDIILSLILLLNSIDAQAGRIMVIGDSLSVADNSWANIYRDIPGNRLKLLAQSGRAVVDYDLPRDLSPAFGISRVYYALGSNDIGRGVWPGTTSLYLNTHLTTLVQRNFDVTLVLPPVFDDHREASHATRAVMTPFCRKIKCIDLDQIWGTVPTIDGVHPTDQGQVILFDFIMAQ